MIVHLIDGTYELFRQFYGLRRFNKGEDKPFGAVVGVLNSVLMMFEQGATHLGVATDHVIESFRNDLWPGYKTGEGVERSLMNQFHPLEEALESMGGAVWAGPARADDALHQLRTSPPPTLQSKRSPSGTGQDLSQSVIGDRVVQVDRKSATSETQTRFERNSAGPELPDSWRCGYAADGPGNPGHRKDDRCATPHNIRPIESFPSRTRRQPRLSLLFKDIATLRKDAPLFQKTDDIRWKGATSGFPAMAERLGDTRLVDRVTKIENKRAAS